MKKKNTRTAATSVISAIGTLVMMATPYITEFIFDEVEKKRNADREKATSIEENNKLINDITDAKHRLCEIKSELYKKSNTAIDIVGVSAYEDTTSAANDLCKVVNDTLDKINTLLKLDASQCTAVADYRSIALHCMKSAIAEYNELVDEINKLYETLGYFCDEAISMASTKTEKRKALRCKYIFDGKQPPRMPMTLNCDYIGDDETHSK